MEGRYEYDAFGTPYEGDLNGGMNLGYTGKPYDTATGMYNYGYRDYAPAVARFTTEDPVRDGANWFAYVNNDPVNWVDLWGLEDIVAIRALDNYSSENAIYYNFLVEKELDEIRIAAEEKGLTFRVVDGQDATGSRIDSEFADNDTQRLILLYHGKGDGTITDVNGIDYTLPDRTKIGSNLKTVDLVGCYADLAIKSVNAPPNAIPDLRSYNPPGQVIWNGQTNDAVQNRIPESIRTGTDTSGPPSTNVPMFEEYFMSFGSQSNILPGGTQNAKKGN
jgi:RHS repeat-associated protein